MPNTIQLGDPRPRYFDGNVIPLVGGYARFTDVTTDSTKTVYQDKDGTVPFADSANVPLNGDGYLPTVFLGEGDYRMRIYDVNDVERVYIQHLVGAVADAPAQSSLQSVHSFDDKAAVKAVLTPTDNDLAFVFNSAGPAAYWFDSASTQSDDGGLFLRADDATPGAWSLITVGSLYWAPMFDAIPDGSDMLAKLNAAVAGMEYGGVLVLPPVAGVGADYLVGDSWNLRKSGIYVWLPGGTSLSSAVATTHGHTIGFVEGLAYGGSDASIVEDVGIFGGGKVYNSSVGNTENAIAFARAKNYICHGMRVPTATKKGITAQVNCTNGSIKNNHVESANDAGIAVEGPGTHRVVIADNIIESAGASGINVTYTSGAKVDRPRIVGNRILAATGDGISVSNADRPVIEQNDIDGTDRGIVLFQCDDSRLSHNHTKTTERAGLSATSCGGAMVDVGGIYEDSSDAGSGLHPAILIDSPVDESPKLVGVTVRGSNHDYAIETINAAGKTPVIVDESSIVAGTSGDMYTVAHRPDVLGFDQGRRKTQSVNYAASLTADYMQGSYVFVGVLTGNITIEEPDNMKAGETIIFRLVQDGIGGRTVSGGSSAMKMPVNPGIATDGNTVTILQFDYDGTNWRGWVRTTQQGI